jgi:hypothetical protein
VGLWWGSCTLKVKKIIISHLCKINRLQQLGGDANPLSFAPEADTLTNWSTPPEVFHCMHVGKIIRIIVRRVARFFGTTYQNGEKYTK